MRSFLLLACLLLPAPAVPAELPSVDRAVKTGQSARGDAAVVIGVQDYAFLPDAAFARRDAEAFYQFLVYTRGIPSSRVRLLPAETGRGAMLQAVSEAGAQAGPGGVAWVYFAGHGAASPRAGERMLLPANTLANEAGFDEAGVLVQEIQGLAGAGGGDVLVVTDACFTGAGRDGKQFITGRSWVPPTASASGRAAQWDAVVQNQVARPLDAVGHGAFTYFALGALRGWADGQVTGSPDGVVTAEEAQLYVHDALRSIGMGEQTPSLVGAGAEGRTLATIPSKLREQGPVLLASVVSPPPLPYDDPSRESPQQGTGSGTEFSVSTSTSRAEKLRQQGCDDEAVAAGQASRDAALAVQVKAVQSKATAAWKVLSADATACPALRDEREREGCARDVDGFVATARGARATLSEGDEAVKTACGTRTRSYDAVTVAVPVAELDAAAALAAKIRKGPQVAVVMPPASLPSPASGRGAGGEGADWTSPTLGLMKWIPPGSFTMGSPPSEAGRSDDEAQHRVTLSRGFWLQEHEVTQGEWTEVMGTNPSHFSKCGRDCPVEQVSWDDAQKFIAKVSARDAVNYALPTEAQWEYAARGGQSYTYARSDELGDVGWYHGNSGETTHAVCGKRRNGYGLCDMSGNVWEWVSDGYGDYPPGSVTDPSGASAGSLRALRGGSCFSPANARVAYRFWNVPSLRGSFLGLRLARAGP